MVVVTCGGKTGVLFRVVVVVPVIGGDDDECSDSVDAGHVIEDEGGADSDDDGDGKENIDSDIGQ